MPNYRDFLFSLGISPIEAELLRAEPITPPPAPPVYEVRCCCRPGVLLGTLTLERPLDARYLNIPTRDLGVLRLELREVYMPGRGYYKALQLDEQYLPLLRRYPEFKEADHG